MHYPTRTDAGSDDVACDIGHRRESACAENLREFRRERQYRRGAGCQQDRASRLRRFQSHENAVRDVKEQIPDYVAKVYGR